MRYPLLSKPVCLSLHIVKLLLLISGESREAIRILPVVRDVACHRAQWRIVTPIREVRHQSPKDRTAGYIVDIVPVIVET